MPFALFIVVTGLLLLRPAEIVPAFEGWPLYEAAMLGCLALCADRVLAQLTTVRLQESPITICILGVLAAVVMSTAVHQGTAAAAAAGFEIFKILIYHLVLVAVIDSPARLQRFLVCVVAMATAVALLPLLQARGWIHIDLAPTLTEFSYDPRIGVVNVVRMQSVGLDPNDLAMILAPMLLLAWWRCTERSVGVTRFLWIGAIAAMGYVFLRTQSRGGMLCLLTGIAAIGAVRFGIRKTLVVGLIVLPVVFAIAGGRFTDASAMESGTGQSRVRLWSGALMMLREDPFFGTGFGSFLERMGEVAHNSFLQCFAELGFVGGLSFTSAFVLALWMLWRGAPPSLVTLSNRQDILDQQGLQRLRPFLFGAGVAYAIGLMSLSRAYVVPTYMILGLSTVWLRLARPSIAATPPVFDLRLARGLATFGVAFLSVSYAFVQWFLRW